MMIDYRKIIWLIQMIKGQRIESLEVKEFVEQARCNITKQQIHVVASLVCQGAANSNTIIKKLFVIGDLFTGMMCCLSVFPIMSNKEIMQVLNDCNYDTSACMVAIPFLDNAESVIEVMEKTDWDYSLFLLAYPRLVEFLPDNKESISTLFKSLNKGRPGSAEKIIINITEGVIFSVEEWVEKAKEFPNLEILLLRCMIDEHIGENLQKLVEMVKKYNLSRSTLVFTGALTDSQVIALIEQEVYDPEDNWAIFMHATESANGENTLLSILGKCNFDYRATIEANKALSPQGIKTALEGCDYQPDVCFALLSDFQAIISDECRKGCIKAIQNCEYIDEEHYRKVGIVSK